MASEAEFIEPETQRSKKQKFTEGGRPLAHEGGVQEECGRTLGSCLGFLFLHNETDGTNTLAGEAVISLS